MKLDKLIEANKIISGIHGTFKSIKDKDERTYMIFVSDVGKKYVLKSSLKNFLRFEKWKDKSVTANIQKEGSKKINGTKYPLIRIKTTVKIDGEKEEKEKVFQRK